MNRDVPNCKNKLAWTYHKKRWYVDWHVLFGSINPYGGPVWDKELHCPECKGKISDNLQNLKQWDDLADSDIEEMNNSKFTLWKSHCPYCDVILCLLYNHEDNSENKS